VGRRVNQSATRRPATFRRRAQLTSFSQPTIMILRPTLSHSLPVALLFLLPSLVSAQTNTDSFNCHVKVDSLNFNLTNLAGEYNIARLRQTPPSTMQDSLSFNLCEDLKHRDGVAEGDQVRLPHLVCIINYLRSRTVSEWYSSVSYENK
jgi:hypothetical protein